MSSFAEAAVRLPYPGLRSFQRDESDLFFGREGSVNEMINRLRPHHFLAVLGTSGSGKSSLVRIGLLDGLELGLLAEAGSSWRIADFNPGANPLRNLARELSRLSGGSDLETDFLQAFLARGPRSVIEWCKDGHLAKGANLLLLVDQFEELFRYQDYGERQAAEAFVALLIESAKSRDVPIYVVITMRSEYLGACALIEGLAEAINDGQFLTPRLNREQCREAIVGPASVCGTVIAPDLVNRLLNDLEDFAPWDDRDGGDQLDRLVRRADQLPLLQHTLNRLWLRADAARKDKSQEIVLSLADYESIGGLRGAINAHAEEVLAKFGPSLLPRAEQVFRALTDGRSIATAIRRAARFDELVAVCDGDEAGVRVIVDAFRETGVNFLRPDTSQSLAADTIVDISHESLIRQWRRLSLWLQEEGRESQEWTRLGEAAARYRAGEGSRYHGQDLHYWHEHGRPTAAWARRYNQPYVETLAFLDESIAADRSQRRWRIVAVAAAFIVVVGFGGGGLFFTQLSNKNAALAAQTEAAQKAEAEALKQKELADEQRLAAERARTDLDRLVAETSSVFRASVDSGVGEYQNAGNWPAAGALLGALLKQTGSGAGADRKYNPEILDAVRMRLAEQSAFPVWAAAAPGTVLKMQTDGMQRDGRFALGTSESASSAVRLIDRLTGVIVAETSLPEGESPDQNALALVTGDGGEAVIVTASHKVYLWHVGAEGLVDFGSIDAGGAAVRALALDRGAGRIAVALYEEDSEVAVLQSDPPGKLRSWLLSNISALEGDGDQHNAAFNATAIGFWGGGLVVGFNGDDGKPRFAAIGIDSDATTALLPTSLIAALPTPDDRMLVAVDGKPCGKDGAALVGPNGSVSVGGELGCVGVVRFPDSAFQPLGPVVTAYTGESAGPGIVLADVWGLPAEEGGPGYRAVLGDAGNDSAVAGQAPRFVVDLALTGSDVAPRSPSPTADDAPLAMTGEGPARAFIKAQPVAAWLSLAPPDAGKTIVSFVEPQSGTTRALAELSELRRSDAAEPAASSFAARKLEQDWPEDVGTYDAMLAARSGDTIVAIAGGYAAFGKMGGELKLQKLAFAGDCRLAADETPRLTRLVAWSRRSPIFFAIDAAGRVLRITARTGGQGGSGPEVQGASQPQAPRDTATAGATCAGRVRTDSALIAVADPDADRVIVQTNPLEFRILSSSVQSERDFNAALRIPLAVAAEGAAIVPGPADRLALVDKAGNLTVVSSDHPAGDSGGARTTLVPRPVALSASGNRILSVGESGEAVVVDLGIVPFVPVAAGRVPQGASGYRLLADGVTVEAVFAGALWQIPLSPLAPSEELARYTEATAGAVTDPSDLALIALGRSLTREAGATAGEGDLALDGDARCFLAVDALLDAWRVEAGDGMASAGLTTARERAADDCKGPSPMASMGARLAATSHFVSPASDVWPREWSALLQESLAGNRLATRALLTGLRNSSDAFAGAAGEWLNGSPVVGGLILPPELLSEAAAGTAVDEALRRAADERRDSYEPAIHELLGHLAARSGGDRAKLEEAWVQYRIAEILYRHEVGREADANRMAGLRANLARALPADVLLRSWEEAGRWVGNASLAANLVAASSEAQSAPARLAADAEKLVAAADGAEGFRLLTGYLWLNLADLEAKSEPEAARASYKRFVDVLTALPPVDGMRPAMAAALEDVNRRLVELAADKRLGDPATAVTLAPFMLGIAEAGERTWDAASLRAHTETLNAIAALLKDEAAAPPATVLDGLSFNARRFDFAFHLDDEETRAAGSAALAARVALAGLLAERDPKRWDWLAAKGTAEFWQGFRVDDTDMSARTRDLTAAISDLTSARRMAGEAFPAESLYWLTEARRWLPQHDDENYLALVTDGVDEYAALRDAFDAGTWNGPLDRAELLASNSELIAKIADTRAQILFAQGDDWSPADPALQARVLDTLYLVSEWDRIRRLASEAGSTWASMNPGYANAPGYLFGVVGGRLRLDQKGAADDCDRLASFPADPLRRAPAVHYSVLKLDEALAACRKLWGDNEDDPRLNYLLGRLLWQTGDWRSQGIDVLAAAAAAGYPAAFNNIAGYLEAPDVVVADRDAHNLDLRNAFAQRTIQAVFADVYAWLLPLTRTPEHRAGLRWLVERAASLGSADAHVALAKMADTPPADAAYHRAVAAAILQDTDEARAEEILRDIPREFYVDAMDRVDDEWKAESLIDVPAGLVDEIKGATN